MKSDSLPERLQGTDGIRGKVGLACDFPETDPLSVWIQNKILTEEFFELYTFSFCQNLIDSGWAELGDSMICLLYTSPSPRDGLLSRMPSSA